MSWGELEWVDMEPKDAYQFGLLPLVIWREAQNQGYEGMVAVGWSIRNRVTRGGWWGGDYPSVILKHYQYSSFNWNDPNGQKFPKGNEPAWEVALKAAVDVYTGNISDPTGGATSYYDTSISPPPWAASMTMTAETGAFRFYR